MPYGRESWFDPQYEECPVCYTIIGKLHALGCNFEQSVGCDKHYKAIECTCDEI